MKRSLVRAALAATVLSAGFAAMAAPAGAAKPQSEHDRVVAFWTPARVAKAIPRDFERDPVSGKFSPKPDAKPGGGGGGGGTTGSSWTGNGLIAETEGKVLFAMAGTYYVCSATVVKDSNPNYSVVLTAGHCIIDESNGGAFATNWMFIPNYDASPATLTTSGSFCGQTKYGCWTAAGLYGRSEFADAGGFNTEATLHDWGFAVVGPGGKNGTQLDATVAGATGGQGIAFSSVAVGTKVDAFGYPAAGKYHGKDLVYCESSVGLDPLNGNQTYRLPCDMTGGSSGGGWLSPFSNGAGTLMSVNSYGYNGITAMHGPIFNSETQATFDAANSTSSPHNTLVGP